MENNLDKLFKYKLGGQEPEFHPAAWDRMEGLLDEVGMMPAQKKKPNRSRIIYLSLLFIGILCSVIGYNSYTTSNNYGEGSILVDSRKSNLESEQSINSSSQVTESTNSQVADNSNSTTSSPSTTKSEAAINIEVKTSILPSNQLAMSAEENRLDDNTTVKDDFANTLEVKMNSSNVLIAQALQNTQPVTIEKDESYSKSKVDNENANKISTDKSLKNLLIAENPNDNSSENKAYDNVNTDTNTIENEENQNAELKEPELRFVLADVANLKIRSAGLLLANRIIAPQIHKINPSLFEIGIQAVTRFNDGIGYSIGPYVSFKIGNGFAVNLGGQFDSQNFGQGAEISVFDKVYSFGSELSERKFSLDNQKSLRIPLTLRKSFHGFSLFSGLMLNKVFTSEGVSDSGEEIIESVAIENNMISPMIISFQVGTSISLSRYFDIDLSVEYKPKVLATDPSTSNNISRYYPSLGLRYKLFKF